MHIVNLLAGSLFVASVTCNPICKKDFTGACHPVFNLEDETVDSYEDLLAGRIVPQPYGQVKYVNWVVATQPSGGVQPSIGANYITSGPADGPLKNGQLLFQTPDNSDVVELKNKALGYSCSSLGGLTAVPCTIRLRTTSSKLSNYQDAVIDLVYTPKQASGNKFAMYDFTAGPQQVPWERISVELISAASISNTQVNFDAWDYLAEHYK